METLSSNFASYQGLENDCGLAPVEWLAFRIRLRRELKFLLGTGAWDGYDVIYCALGENNDSNKGELDAAKAMPAGGVGLGVRGLCSGAGAGHGGQV
jgi:hypothetical protein